MNIIIIDFKYNIKTQLFHSRGRVRLRLKDTETSVNFINSQLSKQLVGSKRYFFLFTIVKPVK